MRNKNEETHGLEKICEQIDRMNLEESQKRNSFIWKEI